MRFWDSSAIVPLLARQPSTSEATAQFQLDADLVVWWGTGVEAVSAIARLDREGIPQSTVTEALKRLDELATAWREVEPTDRVRIVAGRLLRVHPLRAGDALQLAAAVVASEDRPASLPFVTLDQRLALAAEREGFPVLTWE